MSDDFLHYRLKGTVERGPGWIKIHGPHLETVVPRDWPTAPPNAAPASIDWKYQGRISTMPDNRAPHVKEVWDVTHALPEDDRRLRLHLISSSPYAIAIQADHGTVGYIAWIDGQQHWRTCNAELGPIAMHHTMLDAIRFAITNAGEVNADYAEDQLSYVLNPETDDALHADAERRVSRAVSVAVSLREAYRATQDIAERLAAPPNAAHAPEYSACKVCNDVYATAQLFGDMCRSCREVLGAQQPEAPAK